MKTVLITLTTAGVDTGPFDLYSNSDGYSTPFQANVAKSLLVAGYSATNVPDSATIIRVQSLGTCTNFIDIVINAAPVTTTTTTTSAATTTTTTIPPTTTTTTTNPSTTTTTTTAGPQTASWSYSRDPGSSGKSFTVTKYNGITTTTVVSTSTNGASGTFSYNVGDILTATSTHSPDVADYTSVCFTFDPSGTVVSQDIPAQDTDATASVNAASGGYTIYGCEKEIASGPCDCGIF
jgi:hypothetical protein